MSDKRLGWLKDRFDKRDYLYKATFKAIPDVVILKDYLPEIRDQGMVGSCVGHGIDANLQGRAKRLDVYVGPFSPTWIYNGARAIEGTLLFDIGCYPRDALHWLYMKGCLLEDLWKYDPTKLDTTYPPSHLEPLAAKNPLLSYYRIVDGTDGICEILADGQYVSIGTPWFDKWMNPYMGALPGVSISDAVAGGHETCLFGYDKTQQIFYGINSWSELWGDHGLYTMPFSSFQVFKQLGGYDAHYIGDKEAPEEPEESTCQFSQGIAKALNLTWESFGKRTRFVTVVK